VNQGSDFCIFGKRVCEDGVAIGEARGIAIGRDEGLHQAAQQMKAKGFATAVICEITGLSEAEIEELD